MPDAKLDMHRRSSTLTRGYGLGFTRRARATRTGEVSGLTNNKDAADEAIDTVETALETETGDTSPHLYHHKDADLPLSSVTAIRSLEYGPTKAGVVLDYRRVFNRVDLKREARAQTTRRAGAWSEEWWRDTSAHDSDGRPAGPITFWPHQVGESTAQLRPRSWSWRFGIVTIRMPTILTEPPSPLFQQYIYRINSNTDAQWITAGAFPSKSLLFLGWDEQPLDNGQVFVEWTVAYSRHLWLTMTKPEYDDDLGEWQTMLEDAYAPVTFPTFPVHSVS